MGLVKRLLGREITAADECAQLAAWLPGLHRISMQGRKVFARHLDLEEESFDDDEGFIRARGDLISFVKRGQDAHAAKSEAILMANRIVQELDASNPPKVAKRFVAARREFLLNQSRWWEARDQLTEESVRMSRANLPIRPNRQLEDIIIARMQAIPELHKRVKAEVARMCERCPVECLAATEDPST